MTEASGVSRVIYEWVKSEPTKKVKLLKMSKGFNWEITFEDTDNEKLLSEIKSINAALQAEYGGE